MSRFTDEDKREYVVVIFLSLFIFGFWFFTPLNTLAHEAGHSWSCLMFGGNYMTRNVENGHVTACGPESVLETWSSSQFLIYIMAGITMELAVSLFFVAIPVASLLGFLMYVGVVLDLMKGAYTYDLNAAVKIFPSMSLLQNPIVQTILLFLGMMLLVFSVYYTRRIVKKLNLFGPL